MPADTIVHCPTCNRRKHVSFATCLRGGWPSCCARTMWLLRTTADLEAATRQAIGLGISRLRLEAEPEIERDRR